MPGPERAASSSVARPMSAAVGMIPSAAVTKIARRRRVGELERDRQRDERHQQVRPALRGEQEAADRAGRLIRQSPSRRGAYAVGWSVGPAAADLDSRRVRTRRFGDTDLEASEIGFGTWALGSTWWGDVSEQSGERLLLEALELGITFFETGDAYGQGANEELVGRVLAPASRPDPALDQVRLRARPRAARSTPRASGRSAGTGPSSARALEASLRRLGTDHRRPLPAPQPAHGGDRLRRVLRDPRGAPGRGQDRATTASPSAPRSAGARRACERSPTRDDRLRADRLQPARAGPGARLHGGRRRARRRRDGPGPDLVGPARRQPDARDDLRPRRPPPPPAARVAGRGPRRRSSGFASSAARRPAAPWPRRRSASSSPSRR